MKPCLKCLPPINAQKPPLLLPSLSSSLHPSVTSALFWALCSCTQPPAELSSRNRLKQWCNDEERNEKEGAQIMLKMRPDLGLSRTVVNKPIFNKPQRPANDDILTKWWVQVLQNIRKGFDIHDRAWTWSWMTTFQTFRGEKINRRSLKPA